MKIESRVLLALLTCTDGGGKMFPEKQNGKQTDFPALCPAWMDPLQGNVKE